MEEEEKEKKRHRKRRAMWSKYESKLKEEESRAEGR